MFIAALFTIAKTWKQPKYPLTDEWIKKMHIYAVECHSAIKGMKYCHLQHMDGSRVYHTKSTKSNKRKTNRNPMISLIYRT